MSSILLAASDSAGVVRVCQGTKDANNVPTKTTGGIVNFLKYGASHNVHPPCCLLGPLAMQC